MSTRRLRLKAAHEAGRLQFFTNHAELADRSAFKAWLKPLYDTNWHVYAKRPFAVPEAVLAYLGRYTHRVAISSSRIIGADDKGITFRYKDYRSEGPDRYKTMTLAPSEFIRQFMLHVLPKGIHRIRHYGLLARGPAKAATIARAREQIAATRQPVIPEQQPTNTTPASPNKSIYPCPSCGGRMMIIEVFEAGSNPRRPLPAPIIAIRIDTS